MNKTIDFMPLLLFILIVVNLAKFGETDEIQLCNNLLIWCDNDIFCSRIPNCGSIIDFFYIL